MPEKPLPEVAGFQAFLSGRLWVFGDTLRRLRQRAASLGFDLLNRATGELLEAGAAECAYSMT